MKDTHKWTKSKKLFIFVDCILCLSIIVSAMLIVIDKSRLKNGVIYTDNKKTEAVEKVTTAPDNGIATARLMCAGNNLIHQSIFEQANARSSSDFGYDFSPSYEQVKSIIALSDIAFINQETIIDPERQPVTKDSYFNSPPEILDEMIELGFNVFNQANNHCMDMAASGARNDINLFRSKNNVLLTGLYENSEEMLKPQVVDIKGIKFSFVGFTEKINEPNDSGIGLVCINDENKSEDEIYSTMKTMIDNAKKNSDIVCVSMHWKDSNSTEPLESQENIVSKLLEYGADIIIGTGPQVLQPMEFKENADGEQAVVIWSLGNFICCQEKADQLLGGIADITVTKDKKANKTSIKNIKFIPTVTVYDSDFWNVKIVPFKDFTESIAEEHGVDSDEFSREYVENFYKEMYSDKLEIEVK